MSFIDAYLNHTKDYESPTSFWLWSSYATIGAVLRDSVYKPYGDKKLFPNIYVLFLANSGGRKDAPIGLARDLIEAIHITKVISGRASIQGILDELAKTETDRKSGKILKGGSAILLAPELSSSIVGDEAAVNILTDIYDGKKDFKSVLRTAPSFKIDQIVFTALMGSNLDMLKSIYDTRATHGGLLARTMLVTPDEFRPPNSLWTTAEEEELKKSRVAELILKLKEISLLNGEMTFPPETRAEFDKWYHPFRKIHQKKADKSGIAARIHTSITKMSMILAANDLTLEVRPKHMEQAVDRSLSLLPNYDTFMIGSGKAIQANAGAIIMVELLSCDGYSLSRRDIINRHWQDIGNTEDIDKILVTLESGGVIEIDSSKMNSVSYRLTKTYIEKMGRK